MHLIDAGLKPRSVNRKISSIKKFYHYLLQKEAIVVSPASSIKSVKTSKALPVFVKESDMVDLGKLTELFEDDFSGVRDRLIIELFYQTGIRRAELIGLKLSDWSDGQIKVLGKRNKERIIPVHKNLESLKVLYLSLREGLSVKDDFLILTDKGNKLYPKFVYRKINYYLGEVSRLEKRSPHVLRHTFATHMLNNGAGIETIKELLGHESLVATQVYTHNSFEKLKSIYKQSHPRER
jgi:integrase/recombinase XerC